MRSIWTGAVSFGLINIPIRVYSASEEKALAMDLLHKKDLSPIRYARFCKAEEKEVPYNEIVKGYEYSKGEYVVLEEADFKRVNPQKTKTIEILHFVKIDEVDSLYFDKPYYLEPEKGSAKAYALLRTALKKSKKAALVSFVFKNKEHIGLLVAFDDVLVLNQMRYQSEIRSFEDLQLPAEQKTIGKELEMALSLVEQLSKPFKPENYHDTYTEELLEVIERKAKGRPHTKKTDKAIPASRSQDLMHLLKSSLEKSVKKKTDKPLPQKRTSNVLRSPAKPKKTRARK